MAPASKLRARLITLAPRVALPGIEPGRSCDRWILSPLRLPVPPEGQRAREHSRRHFSCPMDFLALRRIGAFARRFNVSQDVDQVETREWLDAIESVIASEGVE